MKQINNVLTCFIILIYSVAVFSSNSICKITLNVDFDWQRPNDPLSSYPVHVKKVITLDARNPGYAVVFNKTHVINYKTDHQFQFPFTMILLVKPFDVTKKTATFRFELFQYGFQKNYDELITQPKLLLENGQQGSIVFKDPGMKLSVKAVWC